MRGPYIYIWLMQQQSALTYHIMGCLHVEEFAIQGKQEWGGGEQKTKYVGDWEARCHGVRGVGTAINRKQVK